MRADHRIEHVAREAYGRLVAILAARDRDIMAAEDALQEAFVAALVQWPVQGPPNDPEAWLITVAKRRLIDGDRRKALLRVAESQLRSGSSVNEDGPTTQLPDDRLELMLLCAHPAIDPALHAPLILQTVLGLDAVAIAGAFLVPPTAMGQRLVRAKQKIRDAGMPFVLPGDEVLEARLESLLDAIYAAYAVAWEDVNHGGPLHDLTHEAMMLCDAIAIRLPHHAETRGLQALMHYTAAREKARRDAHGDFVPLNEQDIQRWSRPLIAEAERLLRLAASSGELGRYQLEAAIQSAHTTARLTGQKDHSFLLALYEALIRMSPSIGAQVAHAVAASEIHGPEHGLGLLGAMESAKTDGYQAYHATRAELLRRAGHLEEARKTYARAIGLSDSEAVRGFLERRMLTL
jgi:RNA polymerase sigma-70 factor, ECF subfamily